MSTRKRTQRRKHKARLERVTRIYTTTNTLPTVSQLEHIFKIGHQSARSLRRDIIAVNGVGFVKGHSNFSSIISAMQFSDARYSKWLGFTGK